MGKGVARVRLTLIVLHSSSLTRAIATDTKLDVARSKSPRRVLLRGPPKSKPDRNVKRVWDIAAPGGGGLDYSYFVVTAWTLGNWLASQPPPRAWISCTLAVRRRACRLTAVRCVLSSAACEVSTVR